MSDRTRSTIVSQVISRKVGACRTASGAGRYQLQHGATLSLIHRELQQPRPALLESNLGAPCGTQLTAATTTASPSPVSLNLTNSSPAGGTDIAAPVIESDEDGNSQALPTPDSSVANSGCAVLGLLPLPVSAVHVSDCSTPHHHHTHTIT